jgi:hypothetical protein
MDLTGEVWRGLGVDLRLIRAQVSSQDGERQFVDAM